MFNSKPNNFNYDVIDDKEKVLKINYTLFLKPTKLLYICIDFNRGYFPLSLGYFLFIT